MRKTKRRTSLDRDHEVRVGKDDDQRKDLRKTAKRLIKVAKKNPNLWTREDVMYAKLIKKQNKKRKDGNHSSKC
ncbi:MAG: hypothetical protein CMG34_04265 [Candidatus Marinimicrobia bacterium]|nr:hypothetical protein [Candidatus Neomarinimicrobiota bacterium]|tara:strand:- start:1624 stop:1845 length:222 start_codon:yes stop_codon:yes gene_type:complete